MTIRLLAWLCVLLAAPALPARAQGTGPAAGGAPVQLERGWGYRWGDLFARPEEVPGWADSLRAATAWRPAPTTLCPPGNAQSILWLRIRLPDALPDNAVVFVPVIQFSFEAFLDGRRLYGYGPMQAGEAVRYAAYRGHLIRLPHDAGGQVLAFRIFSPEPKLIGLSRPPYLGSEGEILRMALHREIEQTLIGLLFLVIGVLSLLVSLGRRREAHARLPLYFGLFTLCTGLTLVGESFARRLFFPSPVAWYYLTSLGFYLFPVGLLGFFEHVIGAGYRSVVHRLWQVHLAFVAVALLLDATGVAMLPGLRRVFFGLLTISVLVMVVGGIVAMGRGNREARAFGAGILIAALAGLHDAVFLGLDAASDRTEFTAWGALAFVVCMGYVLEHRFFDNMSRLRRYSEELLSQSRELRTAYEQLGEHSATLEQKVEARTEELSRKNEELEEKNERLAEALHRLREAQEQLVLREKMASLGQLTAGIAHEIKNPLNFVNNFAHLSVELADELQAALEAQRARLDDGAAGELEATLADLRESAEKIHYHGRRADDIVRSMMLHARGATEAPRPAAVHALLDEYVHLAYHGVRAQHPGFNAAIERDYDAAVGEVPVVRQEVGRVLLNLLGNAFYALREHAATAGDTFAPRVTLRTRRLDAAVEIRIEDNGPGIPEAIKEKIFEPFFTTKPSGSGTGLGLSLSYDIVTRGHGGTLAVEDAPGGGAAFVLTLPEAGPPAPDTPPDTPPDGAPAGDAPDDET